MSTVVDQKQTGSTVTIDRGEYEALLQAARVTSEFLSGESKSYDSADSFIDSLPGIK